MRTLTKCLALVALQAIVAAPVDAQIQDRSALVSALDSAARAHVANEMVAGVSVAVVRGTDALLVRGYGHVDLEWDVVTPQDASASYEIGSMTKQFTETLDRELWLDFDSLNGLPPEQRLSQLCRWVLDAEADQQRYGLILPGTRIEPDHGANHEFRCLKALALFEAGGAAQRPQARAA